jgi:HD-like signal output (HDOD) protein
MGAYLMGLWGLSAEVVDSIVHHHQPPPAESPVRLTAVVYAANALEHLLSPGSADASAAAAASADIPPVTVSDRFSIWEASCRWQFQEDLARGA